MKRPNPLFRNLSSKIATTPMIFIVLVVFVGSTFWTVASSFTNIKTLPIFTPREFYDAWVGFAQYERLWNTPRWIISIKNLAIYDGYNPAWRVPKPLILRKTHPRIVEFARGKNRQRDRKSVV